MTTNLAFFYWSRLSPK